MLARARVRTRPWSAAVLAMVVAASFGPSAAEAATAITADPQLSTRLDSSGSGPVVSGARTPALRDAVPRAARAPRILIVGTGVERGLFPEPLRGAIEGAAADLDDRHGYGTLAASAVLQLVPDARITSRRIRSFDAGWTMVDLASLARALEDARAAGDAHDLVLLAFPPQAALDPLSELLGHVDYGRFGTGLSLLTEALLATPAATEGPVAGIPDDDALRHRMFARANLKQRDAVERYVRAARAWRRTLAAVDGLSDAGIAVVAPAGDLTRRDGGRVRALSTQTVYGVSALPQVITVGAAYRDGERWRVSPTSGRGPTLALGAKPDVLAPADVVGMLPGDASLPWQDESVRAPLSMLQWASDAVPPTPCPSVTSAYRCVLQASSMVSAAVVASNLASLVASGVPNHVSARSADDDEALRGIAWSAASAHAAIASDADRRAYPWEQGAGVLTGARSLDLAATPVLLDRPDLGEVAWDRAERRTLRVWPGAAPALATSARTTSFVGPDADGAAVATPYDDRGRVSSSVEGWQVTLSAAAARAQGGIHAGALRLDGPSRSVSIPFSLVQGLPLEFHASYAYNEWQGLGAEGERVERASVVLFAGLPPNVGLAGEAFKNLSVSATRALGGDPTFSFVLRAATTRDSFTGAPVSEHGRGRFDSVPPGFYRIHLLSDHSIDAVQERGRDEALGIKLATSGPEAASVPGGGILVGARPGCDAGAARGPLTPACQERDPQVHEIDSGTGLCRVRNGSTQVAFNLYCGEMGLAVPTAMISRAVHQIAFDADRTRSEWKTCGVDLPLDGSRVDFDRIAALAGSCEGSTAPTAWTFTEGARECLAPSERARFPGGHPSDVTATYRALSPTALPGRNLPVGVMTYTFRLPYLNTYTVAGLAFSYVTDDAIVGVRFKTNSGGSGDAANGLLVVDDPDVRAVPALREARARGSVFNEWAVMSANAPTGELSLIVIPTAWTPGGLDPSASIASVQLCDVAMRVATYAKQAWGDATEERGRPVQHFPMLDRGLLAQTDDPTARIRPIYDPTTGSFADAGEEREDLAFAVQIPKNTTTDRSSPHHVRSPIGGPAFLQGVRRWGTDAARHEHVLADDARAHDPGLGVTRLACSEGSSTTDPQRAAAYQTCRAWNAARAQDAVLAELTPELSVNGRFAGTLAIDRATIARAQGNVAWEIADADDGGAFEARWARAGDGYAKRFRVSDFHDDASTLSLSLLSGAITVRRNAAGEPVLTVQAAGVERTWAVSTTLR